MTLRSRLALGLLTIAIILVVPLVVALSSLRTLHTSAQALRDGEFAASLLLGRLREGLADLQQRETALLFVHDAAARDQMAEAVGRVGALTDSLELFKLYTSARDIRDAVADIGTYAPAEYGAALSEHGGTADSLSTQRIRPALTKASHAVQIAERDLRARTQQHVNETASRIIETERLSTIALALALLVAAAIAIWLATSIARPVRALEAGMRAVAEGELDHTLPLSAERGDEFGRLAGSFQQMTTQLAELDRLKAEFVSVASHELKTPINVILGYLELLNEGIYGPLSEQQREIVHTLSTQTRSLARLVKQLLDVTRFEAGGSRLEPRKMALAPFLAELESAFAVLARQRGVTLVIERKPGLPDEVVWDTDRINEVLGNLISNALKFTERGGEVCVTVERIDGAVQIEVRDTGAGIPPDQLPRIFEKFYQADNQNAASHAGTGLGLAIAKQIVDAHRGTIQCDSTPGVGTTFTIVLPVHVATARRSAPQPVPAAV